MFDRLSDHATVNGWIEQLIAIVFSSKDSFIHWKKFDSNLMKISRACVNIQIINFLSFMKHLLPYVQDPRQRQILMQIERCELSDVIDQMLRLQLPLSVVCLIVNDNLKEMNLTLLAKITQSVKQFSQSSIFQKLLDQFRSCDIDTTLFLLQNNLLTLLNKQELMKIVHDLLYQNGQIYYLNHLLTEFQFVDLLFYVESYIESDEHLMKLTFTILPIAVKPEYYAKLSNLLVLLFHKLSTTQCNIATVGMIQFFYLPLHQVANPINLHISTMFPLDVFQPLMYFSLASLDNLLANPLIYANFLQICSFPEFLFSVQSILKTILFIYQQFEQYSNICFSILKQFSKITDFSKVFCSKTDQQFAQYLNNYRIQLTYIQRLQSQKVKHIPQYISNNEDFQDLVGYFIKSTYMIPPNYICEVLTNPAFSAQLQAYFQKQLERQCDFSKLSDEPIIIICIRQCLSTFLLAGEGQAVEKCISALAKALASYLQLDETSCLIVVGSIMMINTQSVMFRAGKKLTSAMDQNDFVSMVSSAPKFDTNQFSPSLLGSIFDSIISCPLTVRVHIFAGICNNNISLSNQVLQLIEALEKTEKLELFTSISMFKQTATNYQVSDNVIDYTIGTLQYIELQQQEMKQTQIAQCLDDFTKIQINDFIYPQMVNLFLQSQETRILNQLFTLLTHFYELCRLQQVDLSNQIIQILQRSILVMISQTKFNFNDILTQNDLNEVMIFVTDFYTNSKKQKIIELIFQILPIILVKSEISEEFLQQILIFLVNCQQQLMFSQYSYIPIELIHRQLNSQIIQELQNKINGIIQKNPQMMQNSNIVYILQSSAKFIQQLNKSKQLIYYDYANLLNLSFRNFEIQSYQLKSITKTQGELILSPIVAANMYCALFETLIMLMRFQSDQQLIQYLHQLISLADTPVEMDQNSIITKSNAILKQFPPYPISAFHCRYILAISLRVIDLLTVKEQQDFFVLIQKQQFTKRTIQMLYQFMDQIGYMPNQFYNPKMYTKEIMECILQQNIQGEVQCKFFDFKQTLSNPTLVSLQNLFKLFTGFDFDLNWIKQQVRTTHNTVLPYFSCVFKTCLETKLFHSGIDQLITQLFSQLLLVNSEGSRIKVGELNIQLSFVIKIAVLLLGNLNKIQLINDQYLQFPDSTEESAFVSSSLVPLFIELIHVNNPKK